VETHEDIFYFYSSSADEKEKWISAIGSLLSIQVKQWSRASISSTEPQLLIAPSAPKSLNKSLALYIIHSIKDQYKRQIALVWLRLLKEAFFYLLPFVLALTFSYQRRISLPLIADKVKNRWVTSKQPQPSFSVCLNHFNFVPYGFFEHLIYFVRQTKTCISIYCLSVWPCDFFYLFSFIRASWGALEACSGI
jgi:hypothetical protein